MALKRSGKLFDLTYLLSKSNNFSLNAKRSFNGLTRYLARFLKENRIGFAAISIFTIFFFAPLLPHVGTYSDGGDSMFNAWTLARNHHCILQDGCPNYSDGNIYFPNKDSMLYSETQLSAGLITLPLHFINPNPIFAYNVWMMLSVFFSGIFMYLLARYLSKGNEFLSITAGLIFEFAPTKMTAMGHLQNLSILYLPLIILFCLKIAQSKIIRKRYCVGLFISLVLLFYASWYQMVFGLMAVGGLFVGFLLFKLCSFKRIVVLSAIILLATVSTLPLAKEYIRFSKSSQASFAVPEQVLFSSSLKDYLIPYSGTYEGREYIKQRPMSKVNGYNPDSSSYHGVVLYLTVFIIISASLVEVRRRRLVSIKQANLILVFTIIAIIGFLASLGPLLKIGYDHSYRIPGYLEQFIIPMPYALVDVFLPQLSFIRAIGRATIIMLFAMCCILALSAPLLLKLSRRKRYAVMILFSMIAIFELAPNAPKHQYYLSTGSYALNNNLPDIYKYVKDNKEVDNIIVLRKEQNYPDAPIPVARAEDVLWAGYHNKNIFNGYSGYEPKAYGPTYGDFVDFNNEDVEKMKNLGLNYLILDKRLSEKSDLPARIQGANLHKEHEDSRYSLYKL